MNRQNIVKSLSATLPTRWLKRLADEARIDLGDDILNVTGQNLRQPGRVSTK